MLNFNPIACWRGLIAALLVLCTASFAAPVTEVGSGTSVDIAVQRLLVVSDFDTPVDLFRRWDTLSVAAPQQGLSEGFSRRALWVRALIKRSESVGGSFWLVMSNPLLDRVDVHLQRPDGSLSSYTAGEDVPKTDAPASTVLPSVPLQLGLGENRLLIRVETRNAIATRLSLRDERTMMFFEHRQLFQLGFLAGTHLIAVLAGLVIALALGERVWVLFSVFATLSGLTLLFLLGLPGWLGGKSFPGLADTLQGVFLVLTVAAVIDFVARLTRTHLDYPRLYVVAARAGWLLAVPASLCVLAGYFTEIILQLQFVILVVIPVLLGLLWRQWRQGLDTAGFFLLGVGAYVVMSLIRVLRNLGVFPSAWWTEGLHEMMSIAYLSVLAFGIATQSAKALARREALEGELIAERTARRSERDFVAMLSHELRTPLATIEASTRILQDIPGLDPVARGARYDKIVRAVGRLRDLFDRLLASDRLRADWHPTDLRPLDLVEFVQQVRDSSVADWPGSDICFRPPQGPAIVAADRGLIGIALGNLIGNALAYGPRDRSIHLEVSPVTRGWRVSVHDFGAPIPPAEREALFAPYVRGIRATATPGAGLGLFIVMRIARLHGGNAGLDCPEGGGNRFWLEIPTGVGREFAVTNS